MINVESFKSFEDASGAPAVITVDGWSFSFDCLGQATDGHLITRSNRAPTKRVAALAAWKYGELLKGLSDAWHAANRAMYSDEPRYADSPAQRHFDGDACQFGYPSWRN
jgi:hypothetical protein